MKVNIYDVAKKAGVSVVTASRVLNGVPTVREYNRKRVLQAMEELNYRPNAAARTLAKGKTGVVGLLTPSLRDAFIDQVVEAVDHYLMEKGYYLALSVIGNRETYQSRSGHLFDQDTVDGMILLTPLFEADYIHALKDRGIPYVLIDNQILPAPGTSVLVDNFSGAYEAVSHLIALGHKRILHLSGTKHFLSARERERGYLTALMDHQLEPLPILPADFSFELGEAAILKAYDGGMEPTAVFAADDMTAFGVIQGLRSLGKQVPEDVSVAGFDDDPLAAQLKPRLTTVRQPAQELGRRGVEALFQEMEDLGGESRVIKIKPELIRRESCSRRS